MSTSQTPRLRDKQENRQTSSQAENQRQRDRGPDRLTMTRMDMLQSRVTSGKEEEKQINIGTHDKIQTLSQPIGTTKASR